MLLDEATSALDTQTEQSVQDALNELGTVGSGYGYGFKVKDIMYML